MEEEDSENVDWTKGAELVTLHKSESEISLPPELAFETLKEKFSLAKKKKLKKLPSAAPQKYFEGHKKEDTEGQKRSPASSLRTIKSDSPAESVITKFAAAKFLSKTGKGKYKAPPMTLQANKNLTSLQTLVKSAAAASLRDSHEGPGTGKVEQSNKIGAKVAKTFLRAARTLKREADSPSQVQDTDGSAENAARLKSLLEEIQTSKNNQTATAPRGATRKAKADASRSSAQASAKREHSANQEAKHIPAQKGKKQASTRSTNRAEASKGAKKKKFKKQLVPMSFSKVEMDLNPELPTERLWRYYLQSTKECIIGNSRLMHAKKEFDQLTKKYISLIEEERQNRKNFIGALQQFCTQNLCVAIRRPTELLDEVKFIKLKQKLDVLVKGQDASRYSRGHLMFQAVNTPFLAGKDFETAIEFIKTIGEEAEAPEEGRMLSEEMLVRGKQRRYPYKVLAVFAKRMVNGGLSGALPRLTRLKKQVDGYGRDNTRYSLERYPTKQHPSKELIKFLSERNVKLNIQQPDTSCAGCSSKCYTCHGQNDADPAEEEMGQTESWQLVKSKGALVWRYLGLDTARGEERVFGHLEAFYDDEKGENEKTFRDYLKVFRETHLKTEQDLEEKLSSKATALVPTVTMETDFFATCKPADKPVAEALEESKELKDTHHLNAADQNQGLVTRKSMAGVFRLRRAFTKIADKRAAQESEDALTRLASYRSEEGSIELASEILVEENDGGEAEHKKSSSPTSIKSLKSKSAFAGTGKKSRSKAKKKIERKVPNKTTSKKVGKAVTKKAAPQR